MLVNVDVIAIDPDATDVVVALKHDNVELVRIGGEVLRRGETRPTGADHADSVLLFPSR